MSLNESEIKSYYRQKLNEFEGSARGMDWKDIQSQHLRFEIISKYIDFLDIPTILDVGCGNGEFKSFTQAKRLDCSYTGIDIVPEMVDLTNQRFGDNTAVLSEIDDIGSNEYDFVIASGTFNAKLGVDKNTWHTFFFENITQMFRACKKAIVFNCMSHRVDYTYDRLFYLSEKEVSDFVFEFLSRRYIVDHSYPLFEMTVAIFKP